MVGALSGPPLLHERLRGDIRQARHRAVGPGEVRTVNDDLMAGQQRQRTARRRIGTGQLPEGDIIAGGILHAVDDALGAQA